MIETLSPLEAKNAILFGRVLCLIEQVKRCATDEVKLMAQEPIVMPKKPLLKALGHISLGAYMDLKEEGLEMVAVDILNQHNWDQFLVT